MSGLSIIKAAQVVPLTEGPGAVIPDPTVKKESPVLKGLTQYVLDRKDAAIAHKNTYIQKELETCDNQYLGEYDSDVQAAIKGMGGTNYYKNLTRSIVDNAVAWVSEVIYRGGETPWSVKPTPVPEIPEEVLNEISMKIGQEIQQTGAMPSSTVLDAQYDKAKEQAIDFAESRARRLSNVLRDQQAEGGFADAVTACIKDMCRYPAAFLKGPFPVTTKEIVWVDGKPEAKDRIKLRWERLNPWNAFPAPNARTPQDNYFMEKEVVERAELVKLSKLPGWSKDEIVKALEEAPDGSDTTNIISGETRRIFYAKKDSSHAGGYADGTVELWRFWGKVQGKLLKEWGASVSDEEDYYHAEVVLVGNHCIRAVINSDPLGRTPVTCCSVYPSSDSIWGNSFPWAVREEQKAANAIARAFINNTVLGSMVFEMIDLDTIEPSHIPNLNKPLTAGERLLYHGNQSNSTSRKPRELYQPVINSESLLSALSYMEQSAHDTANIPKFTSGDGDVQGAGQTATGLRILKDASFKTVRGIITMIETFLIRDSVDYQETWRKKNRPNQNLDGDFTVQVSGLTEKLLREETSTLKKEFLQMSANPIDVQVVTPKHRATVWRSIAKDMGFREKDICMTEDAILEAEKAQQQQMMQQQEEQQQMQEEQMAQQQEMQAEARRREALDAYKEEQKAMLQEREMDINSRDKEFQTQAALHKLELERERHDAELGKMGHDMSIAQQLADAQKNKDKGAKD